MMHCHWSKPEISTEPTKAKLWEPAYSQVLNQRKIKRQRVVCLTTIETTESATNLPYFQDGHKTHDFSLVFRTLHILRQCHLVND